jgi:hypothetical protein
MGEDQHCNPILCRPIQKVQPEATGSFGGNTIRSGCYDHATQVLIDYQTGRPNLFQPAKYSPPTQKDIRSVNGRCAIVKRLIDNDDRSTEI